MTKSPSEFIQFQARGVVTPSPLVHCLSGRHSFHNSSLLAPPAGHTPWRRITLVCRWRRRVARGWRRCRRPSLRTPRRLTSVAVEWTTRTSPSASSGSVTVREGETERGWVARREGGGSIFTLSWRIDPSPFTFSSEYHKTVHKQPSDCTKLRVG